MKRSLRSWLWRVPLQQEIDEELELHLELRTRELVKRGMAPEAARALALKRMGDVRRVKRTCVDVGRKRDREMRFLQWLEEFRADVTFAIRQLRGALADDGVLILGKTELALPAQHGLRWVSTQHRMVAKALDVVGAAARYQQPAEAHTHDTPRAWHDQPDDCHH